MKKILIIGLVAFFMGQFANGQHAQPSASFEKVIHNFGEIKEDKGLVNYAFQFTNTGGQPLVIHHVQASCGCTTPKWTKQPVPPGGKGEVEVTFDPSNRPGNFNKTITVSSNAQNKTTILRITGKVLPREKTMEDIYPRVMGNIRLESSHLPFTKMSPDQTKEEQLKIINTSQQAVKIGFTNVPKHVTIKSVPETLKPGEAGTLVATYNAAMKNDWGFVIDNIFLMQNDQKDYKNRLTLSASIEENFDAWTAEMKDKAPILSLNEKVFDFGEIKQGDKVEHTFKVKNDGKSNLVIRKIKASCGCTAIKPQKTVLSPGETTDILAVFNSAGKSGRQNKSVTIITNDPKSTSVLLRISGNVKVQ